MCLERSFRPSQPLLPRATTPPALPTRTAHVGATRQPPRALPKGATSPPTRQCGSRGALPRPRPARNTRALKQGLVRTSAYNDANSGRGALEAFRTTTKHPRRPPDTCMRTPSPASPSSAPKETKGETPWGEEYGRRRRAHGCAFTESWIGVTRQFMSYRPSKVYRSVIAGFIF